MNQLSLVESTPPSDVEARLEEIAKGVETIQATAIVKLGEKLAEARDLFRYDRREGGFTGWVEKRLGIGKDTAYRMISVFENLGESVARSRHFDGVAKEVLIQLAAPSTPEEVRVKVQQLLIDGEKVTAADVRRLRDEAARAKDEASTTRAERDAILQRARAAEEQLAAASHEPAGFQDADAIAAEVEARVRSEVQVATDLRVRQLAAEKKELAEQIAALQRRIDKLTSPEQPQEDQDLGPNVVKLPAVNEEEDDPLADTDVRTGERAMHQIGGALAIMLNTDIEPHEFWRLSHLYPASRDDLHQKVLRGSSKLAQLAEGFDR